MSHATHPGSRYGRHQGWPGRHRPQRTIPKRSALREGRSRGLSRRRCITIGVLYATGEGVKKDNAEAMRWYKKGTEAGDPLGMLELGWLYAFGEGNARNCPEAIRLNEAAVKAGVRGRR